MNYLEKYNLTKEDIEEIKKHFNKDIINKFEIMEYNVTSILDYLSTFNINSFKNLLLLRPDICFMNLDVLKEKTSKIDSNLIKFIFENEINNLMNFDI